MDTSTDKISDLGIIDLATTDANTFLQQIYAMLEGADPDAHVGIEVRFRDIDGTIKAVWIERWFDVLPEVLQ